MKIVIFHYHLNPGGVTRIIESQVAGLRKVYPDIKMKVLTGYCENIGYYNDLNVDVIINPSINYLEQNNYDKNDLQDRFDEIFKLFKEHIPLDTIFHAHNLNLGKNPLVTLAAHYLLNQGTGVINHAHDFSEDRPANESFLQYIISDTFNFDLKEVMYPLNNRYKIGVLNRFDYNRVINLGISDDNLYYFPNPVYVPFSEEPNKFLNRKMLCDTFSIPSDKIIITYPVRVIERKNIGELILLATLYPNIQFLVTLAPRNPAEIVGYEQWKAFCNQNDINIIFEAGEKANFIEIISGSDYCITTSVREGFGMAYLEPWLIGTPVIGRNIESVTSDIKNEGVRFPFIYNALMVPYHGQNTDFKELDTEQQQMLIQTILNNSFSLQEFSALNKIFDNFPPLISKNEIRKNQKTIIQNFSIEEYARRLYSAYNTLS